jgi:hypothetical protein
MRKPRTSAVLLLTLLVSLAPTPTLAAQHAARESAQPTARTTSPAEWTVARDAFVDLWFHCLAIIGYEGYGPLALYDAGYADRVREIDRSFGGTTLRQQAAELRSALVADSAFEVLHFLPLYFIGQDPALVVSALRAATLQTRRGPNAGSLAQGANAVADALPTTRERQVLTALLDDVEAEWPFVRSERAARDIHDRGTVRELQSTWDDRFAPPLAGYFAATGIARGTILISPAIGSEGRVLRAGNGAVIVAVSASGRGVGENAALLASVRELAFPLLDEIRAPPLPAGTRVAAARARDAAAVRAGALLLDAVDPTLAAEYRRLFSRAIGSRVFEEAFPLDRGAELQLRHLVTSATHGAASPETSYEKY